MLKIQQARPERAMVPSVSAATRGGPWRRRRRWCRLGPGLPRLLWTHDTLATTSLIDLVLCCVALAAIFRGVDCPVRCPHPRGAKSQGAKSRGGADDCQVGVSASSRPGMGYIYQLFKGCSVLPELMQIVWLAAATLQDRFRLCPDALQEQCLARAIRRAHSRESERS